MRCATAEVLSSEAALIGGGAWLSDWSAARGRAQGDRTMSQVLVFALTAALNPTLLTATTVMLLLPSPKRLLFGYLLGAYMTSITLGLLIVFELQGSGAVNTTKNTLSPAASIALGLILLRSPRLGTGRHRALAERRREKKAEQGAEGPRWQQVLSKGRARDTFVVGALLTLPGASYLAGLSLYPSRT